MKKWMLCLGMAMLLAALLCASALAGYNPLTVAADGDGAPVYTASKGGKQAGMLYNGFEDSLSLEETDGRYSLNLTREYTVWINTEKAEKNLPQGWQAGGLNEGLQDRMPCGIFLAEVIRQDAPLYAAPDHRHLAARHAPGTWVRVLGEFGDDSYVDVNGSEGFMPRSALAKVRELSFAQATYPGWVQDAAEQVTVYTGGAPLPVSPSATGYSDQASAYGWKIRDGQTVAVRHRLGDWVQLMEGGFIESRFLDPQGDHSRAYAAVISDQLLDRLNVREYASAEGGVVAKLCAGAQVQVISHTDEWANIYLTGPAGGYEITGCVKLQYLALGPAADSAAAGFTRVRLVRDVFGGDSGFQYRATWSGESKLQAGTPLTVIGVSGGFFDDDPDHFYCLTDTGLLVEVWNDDGLLEPIDTLGISVKASSSVKMRERPDKTARVLATLSSGAKAEVLLRGERWTMVKYKKQIGYVMSRYLKFP